MTGNYKCIRPERLEDLIRNAQLRDDLNAVGKFLYPSHYDMERDFGPQDPRLHIYKAWAGLHFLLTGDEYGGESPLSYVVMGGMALGDEIIGYSPAYYLTQKQVKEASVALNGFCEDELRLRFDPAAFDRKQIYPAGAFDGAFGWYWEYFVLVRDFFQQAAQHGDAILFWVS